jgi:hypothetical protein
MSAGFSGTSRIVVWGTPATRITSTDLVNWSATSGTIRDVNDTDPFYPITKNGRMICFSNASGFNRWSWSYDGVTFYETEGIAGDANATVKAFELTASNDIAWSSFYSSTRNHLMREYSGNSLGVAAPFTQAISGVANNGVVGASATWVVVTENTSVAYSTNDGISFTQVASVNVRRVNWGIDKFLAWHITGSGVGTTYYTSANGISWTSRTFPVEPAKRTSVRFIGGQWFLGGTAGQLYTSPDGITWTSRTSGAGSNGIYGFGYAAGVYVACGAGGYVATSPDGVTWTARSSGTANALYVVGGI